MKIIKPLVFAAALAALSGVSHAAVPVITKGAPPLTALSKSITPKAASSLGAYSVSANAPVIYQTNYWYDGAVMNPPTLPTGAVITNVYYAWGYSFPAAPPNPTGTSYVAEICNIYICGTTGSFSGGTSSFAGEPANTAWQYATSAQAPTTFVIVGGPMAGTPTQLTVNYSY